MASTLRALAMPKRALPIGGVCAVLIAVDTYYTQSAAVLVTSIPMCAIFVLFAPMSWRWLFPFEADRTHSQTAAHLLLYVVFSVACVLIPGVLLPRLFSLEFTFMTDPGSLFISSALFLAGGWGLGRDIDLELNLKHAQNEADRLKLLALNNHLDPHFLFNTLGAIAEWHHEDPNVAEEATLKLASLLRRIVEAVNKPSWPLTEELSLVDDLFSLHLTRDPSFFSIERNIADLQLQVPPMLLLSVAENAIKHGPRAGHRGKLELRVMQRDDAVLIELENPGVYKGPRLGGEGLGMTEKRARLFFGDRASFEMQEKGERTISRLKLPLIAELP